MPSQSALNVSLTPELAAFTKALVRSGRYKSASEVVRDSLRLLEDREAKTAELRRLLQEGMDSGEAVPFNSERLRTRLLRKASEMRTAK